MGNKKISLTASLVSLIKSKDDVLNRYFISVGMKNVFEVTQKIIAARKIENFFAWRLKLSKIIGRKIITDQPGQILELGGGYSLRGLRRCLDDVNVIYVDSDLPAVVIKKRAVLERICREQKIDWPKNYYLIALDVLSEDIFEKTKKIFSPKKKTLIIAEGLTLYFTEQDFKIFLGNIKKALRKFSSAEFYSHEWIKRPKNIFLRLLGRACLVFITGDKIRKCFRTVRAFKIYLKKQGLGKIKLYRYRSGFLFYSIFNQ